MAPSLKQDAQPFQKHVAMQNINQENDTENVPIHFTNDDALFEPAGELEVDDSSSYSDSDSVSEMKSPICKKLKTFSQEIPSSVIDKFAALYQLLILKLPLDLWKSCVNDDFLEQTLEQTLLYTRHDKNFPNFELCKEELLQFFGIIFISGYHSLALEQDYWSNSADLGVELVSASLSRKRFMQIKSMFHLVNNREFRNNSSKMSKVPPIYSIFALIQYRIFCTF